MYGFTRLMFWTRFVVKICVFWWQNYNLKWISIIFVDLNEYFAEMRRLHDDDVICLFLSIPIYLYWYYWSNSKNVQGSAHWLDLACYLNLPATWCSQLEISNSLFMERYLNSSFSQITDFANRFLSQMFVRDRNFSPADANDISPRWTIWSCTSLL